MEKEEMECEENVPAQNGSKLKEQRKTILSENGVPIGLEALFTACRNLYPEQPNPLQVTALVKFWLGGPDPLDYISMYDVPGNPKENIPPHWHYVSFGLSDIHGDGRVHEFTGPNQPSGFGFELTLRLKKEPTDKVPPTWPAGLMQALAKYVFQSESVLCIGDHVSWHSPLDGSNSKLKHMLLTQDTQLNTVSTANGHVTFVQIVGITSEELRAVQHWNGLGVLDIMKKFINTGGPWLVNDMRRNVSIYNMGNTIAEEIECGIEKHGSNLSGVSAKITWKATGTSPLPEDQIPSDHVTAAETEQIRLMLKKGLQISNSDGPEVPPQSSSEPNSEIINKLESLDISINLESGTLLPLALRGRLKHSRHFTFKSVLSNSALTLVSDGVSGTFCSPSFPFCQRGGWLQAYIPSQIIDKMSEDLAALADPDDVKVPAVFTWPQHKLTIRILPED